MKVTPSEYGFGTIENGLPDGPADNFTPPNSSMSEAEVNRLLDASHRELARARLGFPKPYQNLKMKAWGGDHVTLAWHRDEVGAWVSAMKDIAPLVVRNLK